MKKIIVLSLLSYFAISCKKNDEKVVAPKAVPDSLVTSNTPLKSENDDLKEYSPEMISKGLQNKNSDTLYITNFFATWCGPCMQEIPHFRKKMDELAGKPVKFTFISLDNKTDWSTDVSDFADEYEIRNHVLLLDGGLLDPDFFKNNFKTWNGDSIPFTLIKSGNQTDETIGSMTEEMLDEKINTFLVTSSK